MGLLVEPAAAEIVQGGIARPAAYEEAIKADIAALSASIADKEILAQAYQKRGYAVFWADGTTPNAAARAVVGVIGKAGEEGFDREAYGATRLEAWLDGREWTTLTAFDVTLSAAVLAYGRDRLGGRSAALPDTIEALLPVPAPDGARIFADVVRSADPASALAKLGPQDEGYLGLKAALATYRTLAAAGGWPSVPAWAPDAVKLEPGMTDPRVPAFRARLAVTDGAPAVPADKAEFFDEGLKQAMIRFQARHGLIADGTPGRNTIRALNVPVETRLLQIVASLERRRTRVIPDEPYILVNIPEYRLRMVSGGQVIFDTPVVTGRPSRPTPLIASRISSVVLNPTWTVPLKLAGEDIVPKVLKDPEYLAKEGIRIFASFSSDDEEIDPTAIDWTRVSRKHFPYRLRQDPGPLNSLGQVKLNFPNAHDVYMHDTPDKKLLARDVRAFSSGCVRVQNPVDLAEKVLAGTPGWDRARIDATIAAGSLYTVPVARSINVRLVYETAWTDPAGAVNFRQDVYGHDVALAKALVRPVEVAQSAPLATP
jgi:murein L,D-transpeptidase YcbB/YkuD